MSDPTPSSTIPDPVPPTPNPTAGTVPQTGTPATSAGVTNPTLTPQGPILTERQMMGCYALVAMGVKAATIKKLEAEDMDEFPNLIMVSRETLEEIRARGLITGVNQDAILKFQAWHVKYLSYQNPPLKTKAELSTVFDTDVLNDFMSQSSNSFTKFTKSCPTQFLHQKLSTSNKPMRVDSNTLNPLDLSKFPSWNGRKDTWDTFHTKLKAILSMNKLRRLLENNNKNKDDSEQLYHILAHCTINGLMKNTVLQYESTLNGITSLERSTYGHGTN